jgi:hypothetical protein
VVTYRNTKTGVTVNLAKPNAAMDCSKRWERIEEATVDQGDEPGGGEPFDPLAHTVEEVNDYLAGADRDERERVIQAECDGKSRRGIIQGPHAGPSRLES